MFEKKSHSLLGFELEHTYFDIDHLWLFWMFKTITESHCLGLLYVTFLQSIWIYVGYHWRLLRKNFMSVSRQPLGATEIIHRGVKALWTHCVPGSLNKKDPGFWHGIMQKHKPQNTEIAMTTVHSSHPAASVRLQWRRLEGKS